MPATSRAWSTLPVTRRPATGPADIPFLTREPGGTRRSSTRAVVGRPGRRGCSSVPGRRSQLRRHPAHHRTPRWSRHPARTSSTASPADNETLRPGAGPGLHYRLRRAPRSALAFRAGGDPPPDLDLKADTPTGPTTASLRCTSRRLRRTRQAASALTTAAAGPADSTGERSRSSAHTSCTSGLKTRGDGFLKSRQQQLSAWEPATALSTGLEGASANGNGVSTSSVHKRRSLAPPRLRPKSAVTRGGLPRRPAAGAVGRSHQEAADRSPSGAPPLAGIEPGNRRGQRPPGEPPSRSSKDGSRCGSQLRLPDETGRCC